MSHVHVYNACVLGLSHSGNDDITIVKTLMNTIMIPYNENRCDYFFGLHWSLRLTNTLGLLVFEYLLFGN